MCVAHLYFIIVDAIQKHEKAYEQNKSKSRRHNIEVYALINNTGKYVTYVNIGSAQVPGNGRRSQLLILASISGETEGFIRLR